MVEMKMEKGKMLELGCVAQGILPLFLCFTD